MFWRAWLLGLWWHTGKPGQGRHHLSRAKGVPGHLEDFTNEFVAVLPSEVSGWHLSLLPISCLSGACLLPGPHHHTLTIVPAWPQREFRSRATWVIT